MSSQNCHAASEGVMPNRTTPPISYAPPTSTASPFASPTMTSSNPTPTPPLHADTSSMQQFPNINPFFAIPVMAPFMPQQVAGPSQQNAAVTPGANPANPMGFFFSPAQYQEMMQQFFLQMMALAPYANMNTPFPVPNMQMGGVMRPDSQSIVVRGNDRMVEVTARNNGTITEDTLRRAFQLEQDVQSGFLGTTCRREGNVYVFELQREWVGAEFALRWQEARRSRPVTPIEQGAKRRRIETALEELPVDGDLAASVGRYALYYVRDDNYKRCAIPLTTRLAATFRNGENKSIKKGEEVVIRSWLDKKFEVSTRAVRFIEGLDTIILQSDEADLCDKSLILDSVEPRKGMHYLLVIFYQIK